MSTSPKKYGLRSHDPKGPSPRKPIHDKYKKDTSGDRDYRQSYTDDEAEDGWSGGESFDKADSSDLSLNSTPNRSQVNKEPSKKTRKPVESPKSKLDSSTDTSIGGIKNTEKKPTQRHKGVNSAAKPQPSSSWYMIISFALIVVVIAVIYFKPVPPVKDKAITEEERMNKFNEFRQKLKGLKNQFPNQDRSLWLTVLGSLRHIFVDDIPTAPAILLFAVPEDKGRDSDTAKCIAGYLVNTINEMYDKHVDSKSYHISVKTDLKHSNDTEDKKFLDDLLVRSLQEDGSKGVVVDNFESLSGNVALLFHGYCDGDNAPYKDVLIVEIVHTQATEKQLSEDKSYMDKLLTKIWSAHIDDDKISPLLARVANNVAVVTPEKEGHC